MKMGTRWKITIAGTLLLTAATSFHALAFTGWVEEDEGTMIYLDRSGERVTDEWMKRGNAMCYLDENGVVATNQFVEYKDHDCYVDETGALAKNKWVSTLNTDEECDQEVDILWYYFDNSGYMVKENRTPWGIQADVKSHGSYFFDADGHMLSGWQDITNWEGEINTYYLGEGDDGRMRTDWQRMEPREDTEPEDESKSYDPEVWYYFSWEGKQIKNEEKRINRSFYQFDENGVMITGWYPGVEPVNSDFAVNTYYDKESGARVEGWVYAYTQNDYDESEEQYWFYLSKKGQVYNEGSRDAENYSDELGAQIAIKQINNKYYGFDSYGRMLVGLIDTREDRSEDNEDMMLEDYLDVYGPVARTMNTMDPGIFYFDESPQRLGQMRTGKVKLDGISGGVQFYFQNRGCAYAAELIDGCLYGEDGRLVRAESGNEIMSVPYDIYQKNADEEDEPLIPYGEMFAIDKNGKVKKKGTVKLENIKYVVENYIVTDVIED